jgi:hypothetical protein
LLVGVSLTVMRVANTEIRKRHAAPGRPPEDLEKQA